MVVIRLQEEIDSESNAWIYEWLGMNRPFSLETLQQVMDEHPGEGLKFQIHCVGGSVTEGLAIYDTLRTSGREIECNVEGYCHSMAIVLLLAAPKDKRTTNPNASFLIHEVSGGVEGNTTAVERYAEMMRDLQGRILDIFADRTGRNRDELEEIMKEEKVRDAKFMLDHGFVGSINQYNTNKKNMGFLDELKNLISKHEKEDGAGQQAPANEELNRLNERIAQLEQERNEARENVTALTAERDQMQEQVNNLTAERDSAVAERDAKVEEVNNLTAKRDQLQNSLTEANNTIAERDKEINDLKGQLGSHYQPGSRLNGKGAGEGKEEGKKTAEEQKQECREKLGWTDKK